MIFAREVSPGLTKLIKKIDAETAGQQKVGDGQLRRLLSNDENSPKTSRAWPRRRASRRRC